MSLLLPPSGEPCHKAVSPFLRRVRPERWSTTIDALCMHTDLNYIPLQLASLLSFSNADFGDSTVMLIESGSAFTSDWRYTATVHNEVGVKAGCTPGTFTGLFTKDVLPCFSLTATIFKIYCRLQRKYRILRLDKISYRQVPLFNHYLAISRLKCSTCGSSHEAHSSAPNLGYLRLHKHSW